MTDDFDVITEQDKSHMAYGLCVLGHMAVGATMGSIAGGQTLLGAAGGTAWGLFNCRYLAEPLKSKLFTQRGRMSESEFKQVLSAAKRQYPQATKTELMGLIVQARNDLARSPGKYQC